MIKILTGRELELNQALANSMFIDRARQFHDRLGWQVTVDTLGREKDQYDLAHTLYVIAVDEVGLHAGSMRFLPTTYGTMISDHFQNLAQNVDFVSPLIWECTRFCLSEKASPKSTALELFVAGAEILQEFQLLGFIGIFDPFMERIYRRYGVSPKILCQTLGKEGQVVKLGIWYNDILKRAELLSRADRSESKSGPIFENLGTSSDIPRELFAS